MQFDPLMRRGDGQFAPTKMGVADRDKTGISQIDLVRAGKDIRAKINPHRKPLTGKALVRTGPVTISLRRRH